MSKYQKKLQRRIWTTAPRPFCSYCRNEKPHTEAQHKRSTLINRDKFSMFDSWHIEVRNIR